MNLFGVTIAIQPRISGSSQIPIAFKQNLRNGNQI